MSFLINKTRNYKKKIETKFFAVRAEDVRTHYENGSDLSPIIFNDDLRWYEMNVVGEIIKIIRQPPDYEIAR